MKEKLWTKEYTISIMIVLGTALCNSLLFSVMPIYAKNFTSVDTYAGLMTSIFALSALLIRMSTGKWIDKASCKGILITGTIITFISTALYLFCGNLYFAFILRAIQGLGFGISSTAACTLVVQVSKKSRVLDAVGYSAVISTVVGAMAPTIAFAILGKGYTEFTNLFFVTSVISVLTILTVMLVKTKLPNKINNHKEVRKEVSFNYGVIAIPAIILLFTILTQSSTSSFIGLYTIDLGLSGTGTFFILIAIGMFISRLYIDKLVERFNSIKVVLGNSMILFLSMICLSKIENTIELFLISIPIGIALGSIIPILNVMIIDLMPENKKGIANAIFYSMQDIGYTIGPVIFGMMVNGNGYRDIYLVAGLIQLVVGVISISYLIFNKKSLKVQSN